MQNNLLCFGDSNMKFCVKRTLVKRTLVKRTLILIVLSMFLCNLWSVSISVDKIYPQMSKENQKVCKDVLENQMPLEAAKKILLASEQKEISKNDKILMISLAAQIFEQIGSFTEAQKLYTSLSSLYPLGSKESSEELLSFHQEFIPIYWQCTSSSCSYSPCSSISQFKTILFHLSRYHRW